MHWGAHHHSKVIAMPYKRVGKVIYTKSTGRWKVKQRCRSVPNAKSAMRILRGIEERR